MVYFCFYFLMRMVVIFSEGQARLLRDKKKVVGIEREVGVRE